MTWQCKSDSDDNHANPYSWISRAAKEKTKAAKAQKKAAMAPPKAAKAATKTKAARPAQKSAPRVGGKR